MTTETQARPLFAAKLTPHRSLNQRGVRIVAGLAPHDTELLIAKTYGDSFEDTNLETVLSSLEIGRLVVVGAQTDACIVSTLHGAFVRGYDVTLIRDAHTTEDQTAWGASPPERVHWHPRVCRASI